MQKHWIEWKTFEESVKYRKAFWALMRQTGNTAPFWTEEIEANKAD